MLEKRELQRTKPDLLTANRLLRLAADNLIAAEDNLRINHPDVALSLAYNSMLNAGRALMAAKGYRASSESHHKTVVQFCTFSMPPKFSPLIEAFNRYRVRRHDVVYGDVESGSVDADEAKRVIEKAGEFLKEMRNRIH